MNGPIIDIYAEDKTGGGLQNFLIAAAQARRNGLGLPSLRAPRGGQWASPKGNAKLLDWCERYDVFRFERRPRLDHVVFVIDLKEVEPLVKLAPIRPGDLAGRTRVENATIAEMTKRARGNRTDEEWGRISSGFHPFVLRWERESLIASVSDALGLGPPPADIDWCEAPARLMADRHRAAHGNAYAKSTDGLNYLGEIARRPDLIQRVLDANESVRRMVDTLVEL